MKRSLLTGLAILLPFVITIWIVVFLFDFLTDPFTNTIRDLLKHFVDDPEYLVKHENFLIFLGRVFTLVILFFAIALLGFATRKYLFKWFFEQIQKMFQKIPYLKSLFNLVDQVIKSFIPAEKKEIFKGSVIIKFPNDKAEAFGLLSGDAPIVARKGLGDDSLKTVFVPTAPHPVSGFLLMVAEQNIEKVEVTTEQVVKFLVSCGIVHPGEEDETKE